ncbi:pilus assembly protein [Sphingomonas sp. RP10(2022)]|uniref:Pilus assembly protein n=1 Tax=Sphingomonas liriopis TaxID=2949094 RepID=A0A9X2KPX8_9SPHN|nr:TadE/TadG family type IV pilus assembly protein [Sphingomonas liriopis]MCP3735144.1 pilus assembly protein [Sphingomonas liriopis]
MTRRLPPRPLASASARIAGDARGAVLVEFAIVAVPFIALMLAIIQTSLIYFAQETLETTVEAASRSIVTGKRQAADAAGKVAGMTQAQLAERFRRAGCTSMPAFLSCSRLYVEVKNAGNWNDTPTALTFDANGKISNTFAYDLGSQGSVVVVRFMYLWPLQGAPLFNLSNAPSGQRVLFATSVAKSEAYS